LLWRPRTSDTIKPRGTGASLLFAAPLDTVRALSIGTTCTAPPRSRSSLKTLERGSTLQVREGLEFIFCHGQRCPPTKTPKRSRRWPAPPAVRWICRVERWFCLNPSKRPDGHPYLGQASCKSISRLHPTDHTKKTKRFNWTIVHGILAGSSSLQKTTKTYAASFRRSD